MILLATPTADRAAILTIVIVALLLGLLAFEPALHQSGDNVEYLILARALSTGQGYTTLSSPVPHPETQRTPGYAVFLAFFMWLFGEQLWLLKTTSILLFAASGWLAYRFLRCQRGSTLLLSAFGVWLYLWNLEILNLATTTGSEMLYTVLTLAALLGATRYVGRRDEAVRPECVKNPPGQWRWLAVMVLAAVAAIYVRPNGISLIPALGMFLLLRRRWSAVLVGVVVGGLLLTPLIQMQRQAAAQGPTYMSYLATAEDDQGDGRVRTVGDFMRRSLRTAAAQTLNLGQLLIVRPTHFQLRPRPVFESPPPGETAAAEGRGETGPGEMLRHGSRYLLGLVSLLGFVITWRGRGGALHWYTLMNIVLLIITPFPRGRYLLPLLPMFGWFLAMAIMWGVTCFARSRTPGRSVLVLLALLALGLTTVGVAQRVALNWENRGLSWHAPQRYALEGSDFVNYAAALEWIGRHTPPEAVVAARKPYNVYWVTGRRATWKPLWQQDPQAVWLALVENLSHGPSYALEDGFHNRFHGDITRRNLRPALAANREMVQAEAAWERPTTVLWRLRPEAGAGKISPRQPQPDAGQRGLLPTQ